MWRPKCTTQQLGVDVKVDNYQLLCRSPPRLTRSWGGVRGPYRDGPASGENTRHLCRLKISGYFGLDPPKRGSGLVGNKLISVQRGSLEGAGVVGGGRPSARARPMPRHCRVSSCVLNARPNNCTRKQPHLPLLTCSVLVALTPASRAPHAASRSMTMRATPWEPSTNQLLLSTTVSTHQQLFRLSNDLRLINNSETWS